MAYSWHGVTWTAFEGLVMEQRLFQAMNLAQQNASQQSVPQEHRDDMHWILRHGERQANRQGRQLRTLRVPHASRSLLK